MKSGELQVKDFSVSYFGYGQKVRGVEFSLREGEVMCLLGEEGCGKTSLMRGLAGLEEVGGSVTLGGVDFLRLPLKEREVCYTFGADSLDKKKTVAQNIVKPLVLRGADERYIKQRLQYAAELMDLENILPEKVKGLPPYYLAKTILARAFVRPTDLLLLDDLPAQLSYSQRERVFNRMRLACARAGGRIIYATQRPEEAEGFPHKVGVMSEGALVQCASMRDIYKFPTHRAAAEIFKRDFTLLPATARLNGEWLVEACGSKLPCPPLLNKIYDGRQVIACVRREDVSVGGGITAKVLGAYDCGRERFLRLGVPGGIIYCNAEAPIGSEISVSVSRAAFVFDAASGYNIAARNR